MSLPTSNLIGIQIPALGSLYCEGAVGACVGAAGAAPIFVDIDRGKLGGKLLRYKLIDVQCTRKRPEYWYTIIAKTTHETTTQSSHLY